MTMTCAAAQRMTEEEYVGIGLELTKLTVATLSMSDLDRFVDECRRQVDEQRDEPARVALATAEALQRFRVELQALFASAPPAREGTD